MLQHSSSQRLTESVLGWTERHTHAVHWNAIWGAGLGVQLLLQKRESGGGCRRLCYLSLWLQYMAVLYPACARYVGQPLVGLQGFLWGKHCVILHCYWRGKR